MKIWKWFLAILLVSVVGFAAGCGDDDFNFDGDDDGSGDDNDDEVGCEYSGWIENIGMEWSDSQDGWGVLQFHLCVSPTGGTDGWLDCTYYEEGGSPSGQQYGYLGTIPGEMLLTTDCSSPAYYTVDCTDDPQNTRNFTAVCMCENSQIVVEVDGTADCSDLL